MRKLQTNAHWLLTGLSESALAQLGAALMLGLLSPRDLPAGVPALWLLTGTYLLGGLAGRRLQRWQSPRARQFQAALGLAAALLSGAAVHLLGRGTPLGLAGSPVAFTGVLGAWYSWWQGSLAGARGVTFSDMVSGFPLRAVVTLAALVVAALARGVLPPAAPALFYRQVALFFAAGLAALVLIRNEEFRGRLSGTARTADALSLGLSLAALALVLLGLVTDAALSGHRDQLLTWLGIKPLLSLLATLLAPLITAAAWLMSPLVDLIRAWLRAALAQRNPLPLLAPGQDQELPPLEPTGELAPWLGTALEIGLAVAVLAGLLVVLLRVQGRRRQAEYAGSEVRESLGAWSGLRADLRAALAALWAGLRRWFVRPGSGEAAGSPLPLGPGDEPPAVRDVRAAFRRLQEIGRRLGRPRQPAQTPTTYSRHLAGVLPEAEEPLATLAELYNQVRYGPAVHAAPVAAPTPAAPAGPAGPVASTAPVAAPAPAAAVAALDQIEAAARRRAGEPHF